MAKIYPNIFDHFQSFVIQKLTMEATNGPVKGVLLIGGQTLLEILEGNEYTHQDLASLLQHMDEKRPHLTAARRYVALWNLKHGQYTSKFCDITNQIIEEFLSQDEEDYDFPEMTAHLIEAVRKDEEGLADDKANGVTDGSIWAEKKWEWRMFQR